MEETHENRLMGADTWEQTHMEWMHKGGCIHLGRPTDADEAIHSEPERPHLPQGQGEGPSAAPAAAPLCLPRALPVTMARVAAGLAAPGRTLVRHPCDAHQVDMATSIQAVDAVAGGAAQRGVQLLHPLLLLLLYIPLLCMRGQLVSETSRLRNRGQIVTEER